MHNVSIEVHTNSFRAVRGRSILCAVLDECAFFRDENFASPDTEVDAAISPGLARVPGSMKILISSVHKRSGLLYQRYRDFYGKDNDNILVVRGSTLQFNPSFDEMVFPYVIARARQLMLWPADKIVRWPMRHRFSPFIARGIFL